jgi:hypothetical protein
MKKYILIVQKIEEPQKENRYWKNMDKFLISPPHIIFEGEMSADGTIEILKHLYDLVQRERCEEEIKQNK